jgi:O-antigen ligase
MTFTALNTLTFADVAPEERAGATALNAMLQQLATSLGVAAAALSLNLSLAVWHAPMLRLFDFRIAFLAAAAVSAIAALGFLNLPRDAGHEVRGGVGAR